MSSLHLMEFKGADHRLGEAERDSSSLIYLLRAIICLLESGVAASSMVLDAQDHLASV